MKLRKKKWRKCFQFFYHPSRIAHHLPCRRAFRVKVTIIWGSIYFLLLFFFSFLEGILPQFPTAWEFHHSTVILIPLKKEKKLPPHYFLLLLFPSMRVVTGPGLTRMEQAYKMEKRGGGIRRGACYVWRQGLKVRRILIRNVLITTSCALIKKSPPLTPPPTPSREVHLLARYQND